MHTAEKAQTASVAVRINIPGSPDVSLICKAVPTFKSEIAAIALAGAPPPCFVTTFAAAEAIFAGLAKKFPNDANAIESAPTTPIPIAPLRSTFKTLEIVRFLGKIANAKTNHIIKYAVSGAKKYGVV